MEKLAVMHPELKNAGEITEMIVLCDIIDHGVPDITLSDLLHMWSNIDISKNAWIVRSEMNEIIGYAFLDVRGEDRMDTCVFVHPEFKNKGIGACCFQLLKKEQLS
jgi:mycothiol synthase